MSEPRYETGKDFSNAVTSRARVRSRDTNRDASPTDTS